MHTQVVWDVTPCRLVNSYQRFGGACCFHLQGIRRQHTPPKVSLHQSTRYNIPEDVDLDQNPRENLKSRNDGDVTSCRLHCVKRF